MGLNLRERRNKRDNHNDRHKSTQLKIGKRTTILAYVTMILATIIVILPLAWLVSTSLKTQAEVTYNPWGLPKSLQFINYVKAWEGSSMDKYLINSVYTALLTIVLTVVTCTPMAYVLSRFRFKGNRLLYYFVIAGMMIPIHSAIIPLYILAQNLNMKNSLSALSLIYGAFRIPVSVFILESFMSMIPRELEECALIDGCSVSKIFFRIIAPLTKDGIVTVSILSLLACWNELMVAMLLISKPDTKTLPIGLMGFITEYNSQYTQLAAGLIIAIVPGIIFYIFAQERIQKGLIAGSIKG